LRAASDDGSKGGGEGETEREAGSPAGASTKRRVDDVKLELLTGLGDRWARAAARSWRTPIPEIAHLGSR
jgi:hypothetical protein